MRSATNTHREIRIDVAPLASLYGPPAPSARESQWPPCYNRRKAPRRFRQLRGRSSRGITSRYCEAGPWRSYTMYWFQLGFKGNGKGESVFFIVWNLFPVECSPYFPVYYFVIIPWLFWTPHAYIQVPTDANHDGFPITITHARVTPLDKLLSVVSIMRTLFPSAVAMNSTMK